MLKNNRRENCYYFGKKMKMNLVKNLMWMLLIAALLSCKTTDGIIAPFDAGTGGLIIDSSMKGAKIYIDYRDTEQVTPARLSDIPTGLHTVHLFAGGYRSYPDSMLVQVKDGEEISVDFDMQENPSVGDLTVKSTPTGALVIIDNLPFGRTPVIVTGLPSGNHFLKILKGNYTSIEQTATIKANQNVTINHELTLMEQRILLEHFSNVDCPPCPEADEIIEDVLTETGSDLLSVISYHPDFPGKQDPMFLAASEANSSRYEYYGYPPLPYVVVDGTHPLAGTNNLKSRLNETIAQSRGRPLLVTMDFWDLSEKLQPSDEIRGRIELNALDNLEATSMVLQIVLIERVIEFPLAPGSNGQDRFTDVMRAFYPSTNGTAISLIPGSTSFIDFNLQKKAEWTGDLQLVAFLQDTATREVLQSIWSVRN
jgi:hypothetical protein